MFRPSAILLLSTAVMAGCADLRWHKPGAAQVTLEQDLERCRQSARLQAGQEVLPSIAVSPIIGADPQGRPIVVQLYQRDTERFVAEQELTRSCMRGRGYELAPAEKR